MSEDKEQAGFLEQTVLSVNLMRLVTRIRAGKYDLTHHPSSHLANNASFMVLNENGLPIHNPQAEMVGFFYGALMAYAHRNPSSFENVLGVAPDHYLGVSSYYPKNPVFFKLHSREE